MAVRDPTRAAAEGQVRILKQAFSAGCVSEARTDLPRLQCMYGLRHQAPACFDLAPCTALKPPAVSRAARSGTRAPHTTT